MAIRPAKRWIKIKHIQPRTQKSTRNKNLQRGFLHCVFIWNIEKLGIVGTPEDCVKKISADMEKGISKYTIFFSDVMNPKTIELFAKEVITEFR